MKNFYSIYHQNFARVAVCNFPVSLANPSENKERILQLVKECDQQWVAVSVFPELCISGYSIEDIRLQQVLLADVEAAIEHLRQESYKLFPLMIVGAPLIYQGGLYNCAVVIHRGKVLGVIPKTYLPNYREFYEGRQFVSGKGIIAKYLILNKQLIPFGTDLLFQAEDYPNLIVGAEICEDMWVPNPPSSQACMSGATIIANLSASNITIGKAETRLLLCRSQSARGLCAYLYAAAGEGESSTEIAWDGQLSIIENGNVIAQTDRFPQGNVSLIRDIDLDLLMQERLHMGSFHQGGMDSSYRCIGYSLTPPDKDIGFYRTVERFPFVPSDSKQLEQDCFEAYMIQVAALKQRMQATGLKKMIIGISGGLDSTQALLVATKVADELKLGRQAILGYTMPGFGTSNQTETNAIELMEALGVQVNRLDIRPSAQLMLKEIGHPFSRNESIYDITFENVQAGLRTDYLFRLANQHHGIVIGTGDLSESALGWCTYGVGDQMSHYHVNAGIPKTLIQHLIRWVIASNHFSSEVGVILKRIIETEISPELIPAQAEEELQSTETIVGPYELQDFNLYYVLKYGFKPSKIAFLSYKAWSSLTQGEWPSNYPIDKRKSYSIEEIQSWLVVFIKRFFEFSQFKRSAMPNGPKISGGGGLSPRGDWRAPSDGNAAIWLKELQENVPSKRM